MKSSLFLIILFVIVFSGCQITKCNAQSILSDPHDLEWQSKLKALEVLQSKCNNCHRITNSNKVFATDNMDSFAQKIYEQVFVLQRMPKGKNKRKKMTEEELLSIKTWLDLTISNNNKNTH